MATKANDSMQMRLATWERDMTRMTDKMNSLEIGRLKEENPSVVSPLVVDTAPRRPEPMDWRMSLPIMSDKLKAPRKRPVPDSTPSSIFPNPVEKCRRILTFDRPAKQNKSAGSGPSIHSSETLSRHP